VPFLLADPTGTLQGWSGSIDIMVEARQRLWLLDWKTHDLEGIQPGRAGLIHLLEEGDYLLQARLYLGALHAELRARQLPIEVGGFIFVFTRALESGSTATIHTDPHGRLCDVLR
jgi:ATP-dependent exoDNAse (exonuclease V) beta subunit